MNIDANPTNADWPKTWAKRTKIENDWISNHDDLLAFSDLLIDIGELRTPQAVHYFFEKPWKWTPVFELWVRLGRPTEDEPDKLDEFIIDRREIR